MPTMSERFRHSAPPILGAAALFGWVIAYAEALPRLAAGPLCSARDDLFTFAGHCPACGVAALLTVAFVVSAAAARRPVATQARACG